MAIRYMAGRVLLSVDGWRVLLNECIYIRIEMNVDTMNVGQGHMNALNGGRIHMAGGGHIFLKR